MRKSKKIFYISGIISLTFIAPLFYLIAQPTLEYLNLRVLDIGLPNSYNALPKVFRNYQAIPIPANFGCKKEEEFIHLISKIQEEKIENSGLRFQFSDQNTYGDLVKMLNIMLKTKQDAYGIDMEVINSTYVIYMKPDNIRYGSCIVYNNMDEYNYDRSSFFEKIINFSPRETYYLIFGFLLFLYAAVLKPKLKLQHR